MPRQTDHQPAIVTPVSWPPILAVGQQLFHIAPHSVKIERFDSGTVVVACIHRVCPRVVLMQDVQVQRFGPPLGDRILSAGIAAMHDGAAAARFMMWGIAVHEISPCWIRG